VRARKFRAVAVLGVVGLADVAGIVEQRDDQAELCSIGTESLFGRVHTVVSGQKPGHRKRVVERMLQVVVDRVAAEVARKLAREQPLEIRKRLRDAIEVLARPRLATQLLDGVTHGRDRTDLHGVGDVVVAAAILHFFYGTRTERTVLSGESSPFVGKHP
jgi:hypothetical protein